MWSPTQSAALDKVAAWRKDPSAPQVFRLFGTAGSGKSTLAKHFAESLDGRVVYCAFTGKAALVMRHKGCAEASTIHKLIYQPAGDPPSLEMIAKLRAEWSRLSTIDEPGARMTAEGLAQQVRRAEEDGKRTGPRFSLNLASEVRDAALVIVDECSMIDERIGRDLESFGTKLLVLGDPAQLPPIYGAGYFTRQAPDVLLDEVHRQALDSPILYLADLARNGQPLPYGKHGDCEVLRYGDPSLEQRALAAEMILVGRNRTRHACNAKIRRLQGRDHEAAPVAGDRAICLRNDHELGLLNGSTWTIERCVADLDKMTAAIEVASRDEEADRVECSTWLHHFMAREDEIRGLTRRERQEFGYGWAITVHKSQGSQYDNVLLFDESAQFGRDAHRHLYTGITRTAKTLTVVR